MDHRIRRDSRGTYNSILMREAIAFQSNHRVKPQERSLNLAGLEGTEGSLILDHGLNMGGRTYS